MAIGVKKFLKYFVFLFFALVVLIVGAMFAIPYFFKDELLSLAKKEINKNINAKVDFKDLDLSFFKSFPNLSADLTDFSVVGIQKFEGVPLVKLKTLRLGLDFWSVYNRGSQPIEVQSIALIEPVLNVKVLADSSANYDIAKSKSKESESGEYKLKLKHYSIENGSLVYDDHLTGQLAVIKGLNHKGEASFSNTVYDIDTKTTIAELSYTKGLITYLNKAKFSADLVVNADNNAKKYTFKENKIALNALEFKFDGWVRTPTAKQTIMDVKFASNENSFKSLYSLIPAAYTKDYDNVKVKGEASVSGFVKGVAEGKNQPAFDVKIGVKDGFIQYPGLPMSVENIDTRMQISSPQSNTLDKMEVNIPSFSMKLGGNPISAKLLLKTPISDPYINSDVKGKLVLSDLAKSFPMESIKQLNGLLNFDLHANTRMSYIEQKQYELVDVKGFIDLKDMKYQSAGKPLVLLNNLNMNFTPNSAKINEFNVKAGKSDFTGSAEFDNLLTLISPKNTLKGSLTLRSNYFDANEWTGKSAAQPTEKAVRSSATAVEEPFNLFDISTDLVMNRIKYEEKEISNLKIKGSLAPTLARLENLEMFYDQTDFKLAGEAKNWWNWFYHGEVLKGSMSLNSSKLDLNRFMSNKSASTTTSPSTTTTGSIDVPSNLDLSLAANFGELIYTNYNLKNCQGQMFVKDQKVILSNFKANTLGGAFVLNGSYSTPKSQKPQFDMDMKIEKFSFPEVFSNVATAKTFAPIIQHLEGVFNSNLKMKGELKPDLMPDLNTLDIDAFLQTLNTTVKGTQLKPLQAIASQLGIKDLENFNISNTSNWFTIKKGIFELKPASYKVKDMNIVLGGQHSLTNEMNYKVNFEVPRNKLNVNQATSTANNFINTLSSQAKSKGLDINVGEFIKFDVLVSGTMSNPKFKIQFQEMAKSIGNMAAQVADQVKAEAEKRAKEAIELAKNEADRLKKDLEDKAKTEAARLKKELEDKVKAEAEKRLKELAEKGKINPEDAKKELENLSKMEAEKLRKEAEEKAKAELEKLKQNAGNLLKNPFGKKN